MPKDVSIDRAPDRRRIIVLFGGQSAEHDVSCTSARHVVAAIDPLKYAVEPIGITRTGEWVRADATVQALEHGADTLPAQLVANGTRLDPLPVLAATSAGPPVVFPVLHGPQGEDGTIQGLLELMNVAYVGTGVLGSALAMDKIKSKEVFEAHGITQARWLGFHSDDLTPSLEADVIADLGLPMFVKPANMGSSVGVSRVDHANALGAALKTAATYDEWIVVEEAIDGREIECSVLGNRYLDVSVAGEIVPGATFYDYEDKYDDGADLLIPAPLAAEELAAMQQLARQAYRALRCEGLARADFFYEADGRGWLVNELNTMPGFTPISMYPKLWAASGLEYRQLIDRLVELALDRHARRSAHRRTDH